MPRALNIPGLLTGFHRAKRREAVDLLPDCVRDVIHLAMSSREALCRQPEWLVIGEAASLVGLIGWVDYITGWEWSFFLFYAVPIVPVVWKSGMRIGFAFAIFCSIIWWLAQVQDNPYRTNWGLAMAMANRLFYFCVLVVAVAAMEAQRESDRKRIASLERAQQLEREILRTSEREQQRLGRDLHDSLGPHLAAIGYAASFLASDLRERDQPEVAKAEKIHELVGEAVALTRGLARTVFPVQMDSTGLAAALEDLAKTTSDLTGKVITFDDIGETLLADPEAGMHLFRIAQEAMNNALKHGAAKRISITLGACEGVIRLVIADDGKGMSQVASGTRGIGLHSMTYRARAMEGELKIDSHPSGGTVVTCEIPDRQPNLTAPAS
ncbi:MAG: sensor histidine kinase [Chthoniobacter sp.]|uniref:sensor histidine kinase n=1 Tax=Chthoniobacter sp. TaxID=2510640 RepID=UPI0032A8738C